MAHTIDGVIEAKKLLATPEQRSSWWTGLAASAFCALAAVLLAGAVVLGPGVEATMDSVAMEALGAD